jgi:hypothetical protein
MAKHLDVGLAEDLALGSAMLEGPGRGSATFDPDAVLRRVQQSIAMTAPSSRRWPSRLVLAGAVTLAVIAIASVATLSGLLNAGGQVRVIETSWAYTYGSIHEIGAASPLVVTGTVESVLREDRVGGLGYPQTVFAVSVNRTVKGALDTTAIHVLQDGGQEGAGTWVELQEFPLMRPGDQVVLFLRPMVRDGETLWVIVGGPEGILKVSSNGAVTPWSSFHVPVPSSLTIDSLPAALD